MARSNADLLAIKAELTSDPKTLGLVAPPAIDDVGNADKLNAVTTLSVKKRALSTAALFNAIDDLEHQSLTTQQARWLDSVLVLEQVDPFLQTSLFAGIDRMFGAETATRASVSAAIVEPGSRIEQMFQEGLLEEGGSVTPSDVANARNAT